MNIREAFVRQLAEAQVGRDKYRRIFELMYGRIPSDDERDMIKRRCLWYENDHSRYSSLVMPAGVGPAPAQGLSSKRSGDKQEALSPTALT